MGNCVGICKNSSIVHTNMDITLDKTCTEGPKEKYYIYTLNPFYSKVIFLQTKIKKFLRYKKPELFKKKQNIFNNKYTNTINNNEQLVTEYGKYENSPQQLSNTSKQKQKKPSIKSQNKNKKLIKYNEEPTNELLIPTIKPYFLEKNIFTEDEFRKNIKHNINKDDPRNGPFDNIRRKFPKIVEGQSSYEGEWKNGKRDGLGLLSWNNDSKFMGNFLENKVFGYGKLWNENGDMYKGNFNEYQTFGFGFYQTKFGAFFKGNWDNDQQSGFGMENWPKGSNFIGEYINGNKNGIGILHFKEKARYEGEFHEGIISGVGTFYFGDDRKYQGEWFNNKMHGYGSIIWVDGNYFEGEFFEDKKNGYGVFYNIDKIYVGMWKNNKLYGNVLIIENGVVKKQFWEDGRAVKMLDDDYEIYFEKFVDDLITKKKKNKKSKKKNSENK